MASENFITINNNNYSFNDGETILDVARRNKIYIPTLCHLADTTPTGACRVCLVEVEGARGLVVSCAMPASKNMVVRTESPKVIKARRTVIALLMISGNHNCAARGISNNDWSDFQLATHEYDKDSQLCPSYGNCELQELAYRYQVSEVIAEMRLSEFKPKYEIEDANPFIIRDFSRCILCGRCVKACNEVQVNNAISIGYRGVQAKIVTKGDATLNQSDCVFCGQCLQVCPVAALTLKDKKYEARPWDMKKTESTCAFCGTGCSIDIYSKNNSIIKVEGTSSSIVNKGSLCVKGRFGNDFLQNKDRITKPLIKKGNDLKEVEWDEALNFISDKLSEIKKEKGPDAIAGLASTRCTNEDNYIMQKFMRGVIGTNNISHCAPLAHASASGSLVDSFGTNAMTNSLEEIESSDVVLLTGSNITENNPVIASKIKRAALKKGTKLIVVDPGQIDISEHAHIYLQPKMGTNTAWINGLMNVIIKENLHDSDYISKKTEDFEKVKEIVEKYSPSHVEEITGIPSDQIMETAKLYANAEKASIYFSENILRPDEVKALANLAMLCGNIGIEGGGLNLLRNQPNAQGVYDMGCMPDHYPGYQKISNNEAASQFAEAWGSQLPKENGLNTIEMFSSINEGKVKAMYIMGENPLLGYHDKELVEEPLKKLDLLVVQDIFMTETAKIAHVVLPTVSFTETRGTFTNTERRVQLVNKAIDPPGEVREDWKIFVQLANKMGNDMTYNSSKEIFDEIRKVVPGYAGISYDRIENEGGLQWPCTSTTDKGTKILHSENFARGKGLFHAVEHKPSAEMPDKEYPFILSSEEVMEHYQTRRVDGLNETYPEGLVEIHPEDAEKLGIKDSDTAKITSKKGSIKIKTKISTRPPRGVVYVPFHFPDSLASNLTGIQINPDANIAEHVPCTVKIEK